MFAMLCLSVVSGCFCCYGGVGSRSIKMGVRWELFRVRRSEEMSFFPQANRQQCSSGAWSVCIVLLSHLTHTPDGACAVSRTIFTSLSETCRLYFQHLRLCIKASQWAASIHSTLGEQISPHCNRSSVKSCRVSQWVASILSMLEDQITPHYDRFGVERRRVSQWHALRTTTAEREDISI